MARGLPPVDEMNHETDFRKAVAQATTAHDLLAGMIEATCERFGVVTLADVERGQQPAVVEHLDKMGAFAFRYGANRVAKEMAVSKTTMYKHLKEICFRFD